VSDQGSYALAGPAEASDTIKSFVGTVRALVKVEAERDAAVAAIGRVRDQHQPSDDDGVQYCGWDGHGGCGQLWPCSTIRALGGLR
jgi:hypothetical protein